MNQVGSIYLIFLCSYLFCSSMSYGVCPKEAPNIAEITEENQTYAAKPYKSYELSRYKGYFSGIFVGHGTLAVLPPTEVNGKWQQSFHTKAATGDWYRYIFVGKDEASGYSRPADFAVSKFHTSQDEGKLFGKHLLQEKWFDFRQKDCSVTEKIVSQGEAEISREFALEYGATDVLSMFFKIRTFDYKIGKVERSLVFSSGKNWWLEALPIREDEITVGAGTFKALKIKLQTFIGKELQQKGEVYMWIATEHKNKLMLKIAGKIKIGYVNFELDEYLEDSRTKINPSESK